MRSRKFDIISCAPRCRAPLGAAADAESSVRDAQLQRAARRWWQTRDLHPLTGKHADPVKDETLHEEENARVAARAERIANFAREHGWIRAGEVYDIVAQTVKDPTRLPLVDSKPKHHGSAWRHRAVMDVKLSEDGITAAERAEDRAIRRAAATRYSPELVRGYDVVSGVTFSNAQVAQLAPDSRVAAKSGPRVWAHIAAATQSAPTSPMKESYLP